MGYQRRVHGSSHIRACSSALPMRLTMAPSSGWLGRALQILVLFVGSGGFASTVATEVHVGFGSCLMQSNLQPHEVRGYRPYRVFSSIAQHQLDSFVFMGDAVYADFPHYYSSRCCSRPPFPRCQQHCFEKGTIGSAEMLDSQYRLLVEDEYFADFVRKVPSVFMWDDHELFDNYREGQDHLYYPTARAAFERHLAHVFNPPPYRPGELYFIHRVPSLPEATLAEFFVLDGRSHRSRDGLLGEQQIQDLQNWLTKRSSVRWRFIVTSTMFAEVGGGGGADNWSLYEKEKRRILDLICESKAEGLILLSGDAHHLTQVEHRSSTPFGMCSVMEFSSSPLASVPLRPQRDPTSYTGKDKGFDERVLFFESGANLYATARLNATVAHIRLWRYEPGPDGGVGGERLVHDARLSRRPVSRTTTDSARCTSACEFIS